MTASDWPADKVERRMVADLVPYARNARTHSDAQVAQIAASITEWGWTVPILVDESGGLIAGHGRVLAARKLGLVDVPAMVAAGWSEARKRAYILADNKLALNAGWDDAMLALELTDLKGAGFDLSLTGFDAAEIAGVLGLSDLMDPTDGEGHKTAPTADMLLWGKHKVPLTGEETTMLEEAFARHLEISGVSFGFVRETLARGEIRS